MREPFAEDGWLDAVQRRYNGHGELVFPAVPALLTHYEDLLCGFFGLLGQPFTSPQREQLRQILTAKLEEAFASGPQSNIFVRYQVAPGSRAPIQYEVASATSSLQEEYDYWVGQRVGPLFGRAGDARVLEIASTLPRGAPVLDIGAGTGRNSIPLAEAGLGVTALELAPALADVLGDEAGSRNLDFPVVCGDVLDDALDVPGGPFAFVFAAEVLPHLRTTAQLEQFFRRVAELATQEATLLVSVFLSEPDYEPTTLARQVGEIAWSSFFTPVEFARALEACGWKLCEQVPVLEFERQRATAWPPTTWYEGWAGGRDAYKGGGSPIALYWTSLKRL